MTGIGNYNTTTQALVSRSNYVFDAAGRMLSSEQKDGAAAGLSAQYGYYADDSLASVTYPGGQRTVSHCYDEQKRAKWVSQSGSRGDFYL